MLEGLRRSIRLSISTKEGAPFASANASHASHAGSTLCLAKIPYPTIQPPKRLRSLKSTGVPGASCRGVRVSLGRQKLTSSRLGRAERNSYQSRSVMRITPRMVGAWLATSRDRTPTSPTRTDTPRNSSPRRRTPASSGSMTRSRNTRPARVRRCRGRGRNGRTRASGARP